MRKIFILSVFVFINLFLISDRAHADTFLNQSEYPDGLILTKNLSPYRVGANGLNMTNSSDLVVEPGVHVYFPYRSSVQMNGGHINIGSSTSSEMVVFDFDQSSVTAERPEVGWGGVSMVGSYADIHSLKILNSFLPMYISSSTSTIDNLLIDGNQNLSNGLEHYGLFVGGSNTIISSSSISNFKTAGIKFIGGNSNIIKSYLSDNVAGVLYEKSRLRPPVVSSLWSKVKRLFGGLVPSAIASVDPAFVLSGSNNNFLNNNLHVVNSDTTSTLDFRNNYWGSVDGPEAFKIVGNILTNPFIAGDKPTCCSNVVFLPGVEGSRLLKDNLGGLNTDQLWEPNINSDVKALYLDSNGKSVDLGVYVGDILDRTNSVGPFFRSNIYKSFIDSMNSMVGSKTINAWKPLPYDWRLDVEDIVKDGVLGATSTNMMIKTIQQMASSSQTGKVTIVTHSNGGLVSKALINELKKKGEDGLVDNLVMVVPPQIGTPHSVPVLLHGDGNNHGLGIVLNEETFRRFAENTSAAYALLPTDNYFKTIQNPVVTFDPSIDQINNFRKIYGDAITSSTSLKSFLLGKDGRSKPAFADISKPNILNSYLLQKESNTQKDLANFVPATSTKIYQIAGWGSQTTSGTNYMTTKHCDFTNFFCVGNTGLALDHKNIKTIDGDGTVVTPSVMVLASSTNYFVNLKNLNMDLKKNFEHGTIMETQPVLNLVKNILIGNDSSGVDYVTKQKPTDTSLSNLELSVHSPVSIDAYDKDGNHTGLVKNPDPSSDLILVEQNIPNSHYEEVGEGKYIYLQNSDSPTIKLNGSGVGTFTFDVIKTVGGISTTTEFADIPVTDNTKAVISLETKSASTTLSLDSDGDGKTDFVLKSNVEIDPITYLKILQKNIKSFGLRPSVERDMLKKIDNVIKLITKEKVKSASQRLKIFSKELSGREWKTKKLSDSQRTEMTKIINNVLDLI